MCHGSDLESLTDLDDDIIITIFSLLDVSSILALRKVGFYPITLEESTNPR